MDPWGFWIACAIGLIVIWLFAKDQFNHPSWDPKDADSHLTRILSVPELRGDRVRRRALLVYSSLMTVVYVILIFLLSSGALAVESLTQDDSPDQQGGATATPDDDSEPRKNGPTLPEPWVPLAVSLAMVGLAPRNKVLLQVETKLREKAHEMMGLPAGLFSAGQAVADADISIDQIGREDVAVDDIGRINKYREAAAKLLPVGRVSRLEQTLHKLLAYKIWVVDGDWPSSNTRKPYNQLELAFATDLKARLGELDDLATASAAASAESVTPTERDAVVQRWDERIRETRKLCGEICVLMFIYSEKDDPAGDRSDSHQRIAKFFERSIDRKGTPELDILINSLIGAVFLATIWGYMAGMAAPKYGVPSDPPLFRALTTALNSFFIYCPAMIVALLWHGQPTDRRPRGIRASSGRRYLVVFAICFVASFVSLAGTNIAWTAIRIGIPGEKLMMAIQYALSLSAPMAVLGAIQGVFVAIYLDVRSGQLASWRSWAFVAANAATLSMWSLAANQFVFPRLYGRPPEASDLLLNVPIAGLIGLTIGLILAWALPRSSGQPSGTGDLVRVPMKGQVLAVILALSGNPVVADEALPFQLGVRADARPFVFERPDGTYGGFLFDMCLAAANNVVPPGGKIEFREVTADNRFDLMESEPLDLLCDPTTITTERSAIWSFTPIVFFANSTLLLRDTVIPIAAAQAPGDCDARNASEVVLVGKVGGTTAGTTLAGARAEGLLPVGPNQALCEVSYDTHLEGMRDICSADGRLSYYVGDADILSAQIEEMRGQGLPCRVAFESSVGQAEPYALVVGRRLGSVQKRLLVQGIYGFFAGDAFRASFAENFGRRRMSPTLETLYSIYRLPRGSETN